MADDNYAWKQIGRSLRLSQGGNEIAVVQTKNGGWFWSLEDEPEEAHGPYEDMEFAQFQCLEAVKEIHLAVSLV